MGGRRARRGLRAGARRVAHARWHALQRQRQPRPVRGSRGTTATFSAELGIAKPENHEIATYEDLLAITTALRGGGYQPLLIPGGGAEYWNWLVDVFLPTSASPEQFRNLSTNFNPAVGGHGELHLDPEVTAVFDQLKTMYDADMFQDGILGMDKAATDALFASGNAGMIMGHSLTPAGLSELAANQLNLDWVLLPGINPEQPSLTDRLQRQHVRHPGERRQPRDGEEVPGAPDEPGDPGPDPRVSPAVDRPASTCPTSPTTRACCSTSPRTARTSAGAAVTPGQLNAVDSKVQAVLTGPQTSEEVGAELDAVRDELRAES